MACDCNYLIFWSGYWLRELINIFYYCDSVQFSSVAQSCQTLCNPMNRSTPGLPVHHQLQEFTQTHVHRVGDAIQPSHPLSSPFPSCPQSLPASESFPMSQLFAWGGQSTGVSALASFLPKILDRDQDHLHGKEMQISNIIKILHTLSGITTASKWHS